MLPPETATPTADNTASLKKARPVYRNIHVSQIVKYRLPPAGIVSIGHRISGVVMFLLLSFGVPSARVRNIDPMSGALVVFISCRRHAIKCLVYDSQGFWLGQNGYRKAASPAGRTPKEVPFVWILWALEGEPCGGAQSVRRNRGSEVMEGKRVIVQ